MTGPITYEEFAKLAEHHNVIPVVESLFSSNETPVGLFEKLCGNRPGTFLLESADQGVWSRYSFIGVESHGTLSKNSGEPAHWTGANLPTAGLETSALASISQFLDTWSAPQLPGLPPLTSGLVGMLGWDVIREIENLPNKPAQAYRVPEMWFAMFSDLVVVDHLTSEVHLVANILVSGNDLEGSYDSAINRIAKLKERLNSTTASFVAHNPGRVELELEANQTEATFLNAIAQAKEHIRQGDVFQVVLSQRFDLEVTATPLDVYRSLRALNPSPYMYLLNQEDSNGAYAIVGSSPEALVTVAADKAVMHPIAGSRPRGLDVEADQAAERSLVADQKERAEHLMLVDLARNDLLKVCKPNSIAVTEFMAIHRFSHIMHLVSTVEGRIRDGVNCLDVFKATFPAGTLSGAPKPRALEIIDNLEPESRGLFGGVVGYFDFAGNADLAIAIRTAFIRDGVARIQAGAGLVLDSDPKSEYEETRTKASAPARAVAQANGFERL